jgi:Flp pilus assembly pilin Flp
MKTVLARLWKEEEGQDLTEYALLLVLPTVVLLWLISSWEKSGLPARVARHREIGPVSIPTS